MGIYRAFFIKNNQKRVELGKVGLILGGSTMQAKFIDYEGKHPDLTNEERLDALEKMVKANLLIQDKDTQSLILITNFAKEQLEKHFARDIVLPFYSHMIQALQAYYEPLLILASGHFKAHTFATMMVEPAHCLLEGLEMYVHNFLEHGSSFAKASTTWLPPLALLLSAYEATSEHNLIHKAQHQTQLLRAYSDTQRQALYAYVMAQIIIDLSCRIDVNELALSHDNNKKHQQWILQKCLDGLENLTHHGIHHPMAIGELAKQWKARGLGLTPPKTEAFHNLEEIHPHEKKERFPAILGEFHRTRKIQQLFENPNTGGQNEELKLSIGPNFEDDWHKKLYDQVLKPYQGIVTGFWIFAVLRGYKSCYQSLKRYHSAFIQALHLIQTELLPLKEANRAAYEQELALINGILYANLYAMIQEFKWHSEAKDLYIDLGSKGLVMEKAPLQIDPENGNICKVKTVETELQLKQAMIKALEAKVQEVHVEKDAIEIKYEKEAELRLTAEARERETATKLEQKTAQNIKLEEELLKSKAKEREFDHVRQGLYKNLAGMMNNHLFFGLADSANKGISLDNVQQEGLTLN